MSGAFGHARLPPSSELLGSTGDPTDKMELDSMVTSSLVMTEGRDALGGRFIVQRAVATGKTDQTMWWCSVVSYRKATVNA